MSYAYGSGGGGSGVSHPRVYGEHGIRGLDDAEEEQRERRVQGSYAYGNGALSSHTSSHSTRFADAALSSTSDHLGHFRESVPPLSQQSRALSSASLEGLEKFKVRDLFAAHAARVQLTRAEVVKETQGELYVPRQPRLLQQGDFQEFSAAANAYAATMANTTAHARAKAAARAAKLGGNTAATPAGAGGGAAAVVAAATATAVAAADPNVARPLPLLPQSNDPFELARAQATESYLQEIWNENRAKEAADERLRKHISKLVGDWAGKLARFEEEVARRQEDTYYAKFRRNENAKLLAQSMPSAAFQGEGGEAEEKMSDPAAAAAAASASSSRRAAHRALYGDAFVTGGGSHHKREAYSSVLVGKHVHQDAWTSGVDLGVIDPKAGRTNKDQAKRKKALIEHQMAHSIAASTLAAPQGPTVLQSILSRASVAPYGSALHAETTTPLTFSSFRPLTSPAQRVGAAAGAGAGDDSAPPSARPVSQPGGVVGGTKLPALGGGAHGIAQPPPGFSVRQTRPAPFAGVPGHGHPPASAAPNPFAAAHVFPSRPLAQAAGIAEPEALGPPPGHIRRRAELNEVERVKARLAESHISVARGTLERALVAPEIRFTHDQAQADLPTPFFGLSENPYAGEKKKKKGKGKKGKGSKKK